MSSRIIEWSLNNRGIVLLLSLVLGVAGIWATGKIKLDAIPDLSDVQVIVQTDFMGQAPQIIEDQVTYPISRAMLQVPYAKVVRGYSAFGASYVYVLFEEGTDLYWARSRVLESLSTITDRMPKGVTPKLGPPATGVGWVYQYALVDESGQHDLAELRSLQDWFLRYELLSVEGVSDVASLGGFVKSYQIEVDPYKLAAYGLSIGMVKMALERSNNEAGGRVIEQAETEFMVRVTGYLKSREDILGIPLMVDKQGASVQIRNVATVAVGPDLRPGILEWNGEGEAVGGIVIMRHGENALATIRAVKQRLAVLKKNLPSGVRILPGYDRSSLIDGAIETLQDKLIEELIVVALVCVLFLLHARSAFVSVVTLPIGILASVLIMNLFGVSANIMSLSGIAIAIGAMVDAAVVMVENAHKHLERDKGRSHFEVILNSAKEVGPALFTSLLIITVSFLPVFAMSEQSGRLFKPLAFTKTFAMASSAFLSITLIPVLMFYFIRGHIRPEKDNPLNRLLLALYRPMARLVLKHKVITILGCLVICLATLYPLQRLGSEFMPPLNEGDLLYMPTMDPGVSAGKATQLLQITDKIIKSFPEVQSVYGKAGRANTATDPAPLSMFETTVTLKPEDKWRPGMTQEKLIQEMDKAIQFPGLANTWTMPIKNRIDMLATGIKTPVGIKLFGDDLTVLSEKAEEIASVLKKLPETTSVYAEKSEGGNYLNVTVRREEAARFGLTVGDVQDTVDSAIGGATVTETVEGLARYPVIVRYPREYRDNLAAIRRVMIDTPSGQRVPLDQLVEFNYEKGPDMIKSENARRTVWIYVDTQTQDMGGYVRKAQKLVSQEVEIPEGYSLAWSGQFEFMQKAAERFQIVIPMTVFLIFLLLFLHFKRIGNALIVMLSLPVGLVGGIWLLYFLGYNLSVAVFIGFISLAGLAAETGVVMLVYLEEAHKRRLEEGRLHTKEDMDACVMEGAVERLRPKIMTVSTILVGLLPIMINTGVGSEVMQRIAAPMVGGIISSTVLTLILIPVIYSLVHGKGLARKTETPSITSGPLALEGSQP